MNMIFERPETAGKRTLKPVSFSPAAGLQFDDRPRTRRPLLIGALLALAALAYLVLAGHLVAILVAAGVIAVVTSLLFAWGMWVMNNIHL